MGRGCAAPPGRGRSGAERSGAEEAPPRGEGPRRRQRRLRRSGWGKGERRSFGGGRDGAPSARQPLPSGKRRGSRGALRPLFFFSPFCRRCVAKALGGGQHGPSGRKAAVARHLPSFRRGLVLGSPGGAADTVCPSHGALRAGRPGVATGIWRGAGSRAARYSPPLRERLVGMGREVRGDPAVRVRRHTGTEAYRGQPAVLCPPSFVLKRVRSGT